MRPAGVRNVGVRYDRALEEWKLRCESCRAYWPLTLEFWQPAWGMTRCRACYGERKASRDRARYRSDPAWRAMRLQANRDQRKAQKRFAYKERWAKLRADPEKYAAYIEARRESNRLSSQRHRDRKRAAA